METQPVSAAGPESVRSQLDLYLHLFLLPLTVLTLTPFSQRHEISEWDNCRYICLSRLSTRERLWLLGFTFLFYVDSPAWTVSFAPHRSWHVFYVHFFSPKSRWSLQQSSNPLYYFMCYFNSIFNPGYIIVFLSQHCTAQRAKPEWRVCSQPTAVMPLSHQGRWC